MCEHGRARQMTWGELLAYTSRLEAQLGVCANGRLRPGSRAASDVCNRRLARKAGIHQSGSDQEGARTHGATIRSFQMGDDHRQRMADVEAALEVIAALADEPAKITPLRDAPALAREAPDGARRPLQDLEGRLAGHACRPGLDGANHRLEGSADPITDVSVQRRRNTVAVELMRGFRLDRGRRTNLEPFEETLLDTEDFTPRASSGSPPF